MTRDDFMAVAWAAFLQYAISEPQMIAAFERDTGKKFPLPATHPLDAMIDVATGYRGSILEDFIRWVTIRHWGIHEAPQAYRESIGA